MKNVFRVGILSLMSVSLTVQASENCEGFTEADLICFENKTSADANEVNANFQALLDKIAKLEATIAEMETPSPPPAGGVLTSNVSYTRWGRNSCPEGADLIYQGFAASGHYNHSGGISSLVCLIDNPTFANDSVNDGDQNGALLYGTEYETKGYGIETLSELHDSDAPCAVCLKPQATLTLMIPGTIHCPADWHQEYEGYLMGTHYTQASAHEVACVDINPETTKSSSDKSANGNLWYPTEAECDALPCPPYVQNRELSCVVCTQ